jgi:hypothetical protein
LSHFDCLQAKTVPIYYNTLLRHHEATEKQDSSRKERAEKFVAAKKCHDKNNHLQ